MANCPAFLSLSHAARALLFELASRYNGRNNGMIGLSVRDAARRCRMAPGTASKAFAELVEKGFIECVQKGAFSLKSRHASEWRLTWEVCDVTGALPSRAFMNWDKEKQNPVSNYSPTVSN
jgi:DNA-binding IclR family transcriptional regulator